MSAGVYLLHFDVGVQRDRRADARHYIGFSDYIELRVEHHVAGRGSPLVAAAAARGPVRLARVWLGQGRGFERRMKRQNHAPRYCPVCCATDGRGLVLGQPRLARNELLLIRAVLRAWREGGQDSCR